MLCAALSLLACSTLRAQHNEARKELERKGIAFSDSSFVRSIRSGNVAQVELLLAAGFDPNKRTSDGLPLEIACRDNRRDIAELLIARGAGFGGEKGTSLHAAASCGLENLVSKLLRDGANVNGRAGAESQTPLLLAVTFNRLETAKALLLNGAAVEVADGRGETPLMRAAAGRMQLVELLLAHGAKVNAKSKSGHTPLHISVQHPGFIAVSRLLLSRGADVAASTNEGWTNLHIALLGRNEQMARFFVDQGLDVNAATKDGWTPLHLAASAGYTAIVIDLLERGAEINAKKGGWTALSFAIDRKHLSTASALVARGGTQ